jgi:hypothetical protein
MPHAHRHCAAAEYQAATVSPYSVKKKQRRWDSIAIRPSRFDTLAKLSRYLRSEKYAFRSARIGAAAGPELRDASLDADLSEP